MPAAEGEDWSRAGTSWEFLKTMCPRGLRVGFLGQALWYKPVILGALHSEAGGCQGHGLPVLYIEFMACLDNLARPCLKIQKLGRSVGIVQGPGLQCLKLIYLFF